MAKSTTKAGKWVTDTGKKTPQSNYGKEKKKLQEQGYKSIKPEYRTYNGKKQVRPVGTK